MKPIMQNISSTLDQSSTLASALAKSWPNAQDAAFVPANPHR